MLVILAIFCLASCGGAEGKDYVSELKLDMTTTSLKQEVTVKTYIDGDTTHFYVPTSVMPEGILKARYLAINTPESTGKIEEWGKRASDFTKSKLKSAQSIIIESDNESWNADSTGSRYLVWVWYRTSETEEYRNLNLEILQNGLAVASNTAQNRYGDICTKALNQARELKLLVHSDEPDPDYFYGQAYPIDLKELRTNLESYIGAKIAVEGVVTCNSGSDGVYVESYDEETDRYYGMYVYYSKNPGPGVKPMLTEGNLVRVVGNVTEFEGTYQISGLIYDARDKTNPYQMKKLGEGHSAAYVELSATDFVDGKDTLQVGGEDGEKVEFGLANLLLGTTVQMNDLVVKKLYTTDTSTDSNGSISITVEKDGKQFVVRTAPLTDADGNMVTEDYFEGKTIDVKGVVDYYNGSYQIKVFLLENITVH